MKTEINPVVLLLAFQKIAEVVPLAAGGNEIDEWYGLSPSADLHILSNEDAFMAVLYPVVNGATQTDRCLVLANIADFDFASVL